MQTAAEPEPASGRGADARRGGTFDACHLWVIATATDDRDEPEVWWLFDTGLKPAAG